MTTITEEMLEGLRERVMRKISPKRFGHTLAVEEMVARLCALYCPEYTLRLRAAALLHDVTKELSNMRIFITMLNTRELKDNQAMVTVTIEINNMEHLRSVMAHLAQINGIISIKRV